VSQTSLATEPIAASLIEQLQLMRRAEQRLFGGLDPAVRDRPIRPNDWSPKDHQAHLTAWKRIQADRFAAIRGGQEFPSDQREDDEINAELQAQTADWSWEAVSAQADEVSARLEDEIRLAGDRVLLDNDRLIGGVFGNGPFHAATHFGWLIEEAGLDAAGVEAFLDEEERALNSTGLPDRDKATGNYNLACAHAIAGRLDRARNLLPAAFRGRPDLVEYSLTDPDLVELKDELEGLAAS